MLKGKKKLITMATAVMFICTLLINSLGISVQAFEHPGIYQDIRIGLVSMSANTMTATLQGEYMLNGQSVPANTVLNLSVTNGLVNINGTEYSEVQLQPVSSGTLVVLFNGTRTYRYYGSFSFRVSAGRVLPINSIDIETYLKGVVGLEMSDSFPIEALKAQAVAARTYALTKLGAERAKGYDIDDTTLYQVYGGFFSTHRNVIRAVDETRGIVLVHNNRLVETLYSASNGGHTEASQNVWTAALAYLIAKPDSFDNENWPGGGSRVFTIEQLDALLKTRNQIQEAEKFIRIDLESITTFPSGRISNLNYEYEDAQGVLRVKSVRKEAARTFLGLPSALYTVTFDSATGVYTFRGKGHGHAVGMSQIGARNRASNGQTFAQILQFYYHGALLVNLTPTARFSTVALTRESIQIGASASVTAQGSGGSGQYLYRFLVRSNSQIIEETAYAQASTYSFTPSAAGEYRISIFVKDKLSSLEFDETRELTLRVFTVPVISAYTIDRQELLTGQQLTLNGQATGTSGSYLYRYVISNGNTVVATSDYRNNGSFSFTPNAAGTYTASLFMRDAASTRDFDERRDVSFVVYGNPSITAFTASASSPAIGQNVDYNVSASGGSGQYTYRFVVLRDGIRVAETNYTTASRYSYIPAQSGNYQVQVFMRDRVSSIDNGTRTLSFSISAPRANPITVSRLPISRGMTGSDVRTIQAALNNLRYSVGTVDGIFGNMTFNAVVSFQRANGLSATGIVDTATFNAINRALTGSGTPSTVVSTPPASVSTPQASAVTVSRLPISRGMTGSDVRVIQTALNNIRYSVGTADGIFGNMTFNAVVSFQRANGLSATGIVDAATLNAINRVLTGANASTGSPAAVVSPSVTVDPRSNPVTVSRLPISRGMTGSDIRAVQTALNNLGYSVGTADGIFGNMTFNAVVRFQRDNRLNASGIVDAATLNSINSALRSRFGPR
jgi:SpoIID/LytB domain protein